MKSIQSQFHNLTISQSHNHTSVLQSHNLTISQSNTLTLSFNKMVIHFKFDHLPTNKVNTRDPIGSKNLNCLERKRMFL